MEDVEHFSCQQQTSGTQKTKANNLPTQKVNNKYSEMTFSRFKVICFLENDSFVSFLLKKLFLSSLCQKWNISLPFLSTPSLCLSTLVSLSSLFLSLFLSIFTFALSPSLFLSISLLLSLPLSLPPLHFNFTFSLPFFLHLLYPFLPPPPSPQPHPPSFFSHFLFHFITLASW